MRPTTKVCAKFESVGKPSHNEDFDGDVAGFLKAVIHWVLHTHMGTSLKITVGRDQEGLAKALGSLAETPKSESDMMALLMGAIKDHESEKENANESAE